MDNLDFFISNSYSSQFLRNAYSDNNLAVKNVDSFISYLKTGKNQIEFASKSPIDVQPILAFYGLVNLLKACSLKYDSQFPKSCSLLAHGVSARKRRKNNFEFLKSEIKVQKNGFFPYVSTVVFQTDIPTYTKFSISELFATIPGLEYLFEFYDIEGHKCDLHILLVHYLILYDLSMIARYEVCWWANLLQNHESYDYPFIKYYLDAFFQNYHFHVFEILNG